MPGFINQLQGKPADPGLATAPAAKPSSVTLDVLNGTAVAGLAGRNAAALRKLGFRVETIDSTASTNTTTVEYPPGAQNQAKAVATAVPGAQLTQTESVKKVTLVLGADGRQASGLAPHPSATSAAHPSSTPPAAPASTGLGCIN